MSTSTWSAKRWLIIFLLGVFLLSVSGIIVIAANYDVESKDSFGRSITDALLTVIAVSVVGTIATLVLSNYNQQQARRDRQAEKRQMQEENQNEYRKEALQKLNKVYAKTKNARRILRAKGFSSQYYKQEDDANLLSLAVYDESMEDLNDGQLELESIIDEMETNRSAFSDPGSLIDKLGKMESYLGDLVSEYEKLRPNFSGNPPVHAIGKMTSLKEFLAKADKKNPDGFKIKFSESCKMARLEMRKDIIFLPKIQE